MTKAATPLSCNRNHNCGKLGVQYNYGDLKVLICRLVLRCTVQTVQKVQLQGQHRHGRMAACGAHV